MLYLTGARVELKQLDAPPTKYSSPLAVFETALEHEKGVTKAINELYDLVAREKDFASQAWLDWFATEQVEEEKTVGQIVDDLKRIGNDGNGVFVSPICEAGNSTGAVSGPVVFAGNGWMIASKGLNPYKDLDVRGKFIAVHGEGQHAA
mgnify:CR=1 FL=1